MASTLDSKGNVVTNGYSTNLTPEQSIPAYDLQSFKKANPNLQFTVEDFNHYNDPNSSVYKPTSTSAIPISSVTTAPQPQFQTPAPQAPTNYGAITTDLASQQDFALQQFQNQQDQMVSDTSKLQNALLGEGAFRAQQAEATGLNTANQEAIKKAAEISALGKQAAAAQQENISQGRQLGSVAAFVAGQGAEIERNRAIKALSLGAELDAIQGNIAVAQSKVDQAVEAQYAPLKQALANKLQMFELNKTLYAQMSDREQKLYNRAQDAAAKEQKKLDQQIADKKDVQNMLIEATPNAPASVIANAKKLAESGASKLAVAQALGVYGGDYLKNEKMRAEINKIKSETVKIDNQSSLLKAQPTGVVTAPNGDAIGIPNETLAAIGKLKLGEGQANAVAFVSRMIQASKAIDKQLGTISPTGGFYETSGYDPTSAGSSVGRFVGSDQSRTYNTNAQDFIRAKLRKESGAAIGKDEFEADAAIYTPAGAGLDEKDLLLAQTKRDEAIKSMIAQSGPAAPYLQQYYEQSKSKGYEYDPYLDGVVSPSLQKATENSVSSSAYANSLLSN